MSKFSGIVDKHKKLVEESAAAKPEVDTHVRATQSEGKFSVIADKQHTKHAKKAPVSLEINDERVEIHDGETLVQAARRHGSYVWFVCDGRGICQTCECRVISGDENLSELSDLERAALRENQRRDGYRLACQARIVHAGPVSVVSRAEELRQRAREVLSDPKGRSLWERLQDLSADSVKATMDVVTGMTRVTPQVIPQLMKSPPTPTRIANYFLDTMRLAGKLWNNGGS